MKVVGGKTKEGLQKKREKQEKVDGGVEYVETLDVEKSESK